MSSFLRHLLLSLALTLSGCTHMTLQYTASIETKKGESGAINFRKSYPLWADTLGCGLTFWVYGGWCWAYVARPFGGDRERIRSDANRLAREKIGEPYVVESEGIARTSWGKESFESTITVYREKKKAITSESSSRKDKKKDEVEEEEESSKKADRPKKDVFVETFHEKNDDDNPLSRKPKLKFLMPYILGVGLGYEWPLSSRWDFEVGYAATIGENNTGAFLQLKQIIAKGYDNHLKAGFVGMKVFAEEYGGYNPKTVAGGIGLEFVTVSGVGLQFIHLPSVNSRPLNIAMLSYYP